MRIEEFTISALRDALRTGALWKTTTWPITRHRASAQVQNPRANPDDLALVIAYVDSEPVGYLGVLPDQMFIDTEALKLGWLTAWWVHPEHRGSGLGAALMLKAASRYRWRIAVSDFSDEARQMYERSGLFRPLKALAGVDFVVRADLGGRRHVQRLRNLAYNALSGPWHTRWARSNPLSSQFSMEYVAELDDSLDAFVRSHSHDELTRRGAAELNWITRYPWVLSTPFPDRGDPYQFSSTLRQFSWYNVKILGPGGDVVGFLMLKLRDGVLSAPYLYYVPEHVKTVADVVCHHAVQLCARRVRIFDRQLIAELGDGGLRHVAQRPCVRNSVVGKGYRDIDFEPYSLQDGDGDCAFT